MRRRAKWPHLAPLICRPFGAFAAKPALQKARSPEILRLPRDSNRIPGQWAYGIDFQLFVEKYKNRVGELTFAGAKKSNPRRNRAPMFVGPLASNLARKDSTHRS